MDRLSKNPESIPADNKDQLSLLDMIPLKDLQQIQDTLAEINGVASVITDTEGNPLTMPSNELAICEIVRQSEHGAADCMAESGDILSKIKQKQ